MKPTELSARPWRRETQCAIKNVSQPVGTGRLVLEMDRDSRLPDRQSRMRLLEGDGGEVKLPLLAHKSVLKPRVAWCILRPKAEASQFRPTDIKQFQMRVQIVLRGIQCRRSVSHEWLLHMQESVHDRLRIADDVGFGLFVKHQCP